MNLLRLKSFPFVMTVWFHMFMKLKKFKLLKKKFKIWFKKRIDSLTLLSNAYQKIFVFVFILSFVSFGVCIYV